MIELVYDLVSQFDNRIAHLWPPYAMFHLPIDLHMSLIIALAFATFDLYIRNVFMVSHIMVITKIRATEQEHLCTAGAKGVWPVEGVYSVEQIHRFLTTNPKIYMFTVRSSCTDLYATGR